MQALDAANRANAEVARLTQLQISNEPPHIYEGEYQHSVDEEYPLRLDELDPDVYNAMEELCARRTAEKPPPTEPIFFISSSPPATDSLVPNKAPEEPRNLLKVRKVSKSFEGKPVNFRSITADFAPFKPLFAGALKPFLNNDDLKETAADLVAQHDAYFLEPTDRKGKSFDNLLKSFVLILRNDYKAEYQTFRDSLGMGAPPKRTPRASKT
jgi:hypothetical protein